MPVYRDFVDALFSMRLPIFGMGAVYVGICLLAGYAFGDSAYWFLAAMGGLVTLARMALLRSYSKEPSQKNAAELSMWERRYAIGSHASAILIALLNVVALSAHDPLLHLMTISLVFGFGAGVVSRISVRPKICVASLLLATVPTVAALVFHALGEAEGFHTQLYAIEALLVAMITGLSLQTVRHLYRSAVEHHTARHDLAQLAKYDPLTGLANRLLLRERFGTSIGEATRSGSRIAIHFLDLDGFKPINDRYGHPAGDAVLKEVAHRLESMVRAEDTVARLGGDEFVVVQTNLQIDEEAELLARRIVRQLSRPFEIDGTAMTVSASVGIATAPQMGLELERLIACADAALYRAKTAGKSRAIFCTDADAASVNLAA